MAEHRFRPKEHLRRGEEFRAVYDRRRSVADEKIIVYGLSNGLPHNRVGLSVSKKKFGKAVRRNRIRRLLREAYRLTKPEMPAGLDLILIPRDGRITYTLAGLRESLAKLVPALANRLDREADGS